MRLRQILEEFLTVKPYNANLNNKDHFERLKIAEEGAEHRKNIDKEFFKDKSYSKKEIDEILKKPKITKTDFDKYKLWIEQGYRSPYTNLMIRLSDLFDGDKYNIDHILPQARITNNSLSNKVVCETEINKDKSNQTGREYVNNPKQREVYCSAHGRKVRVLEDDAYTKLVETQFSGTKKFILFSKEIPKGFTNSQLNNARHIARKAMELLSHIVREKGEVEFRSKNVLPVTGRVTGELKRAWRLNEVWTELVAPRFIRMNELTNSKLFGDWQISKSGTKYFDCNLDKTISEKDESYDIKRIDHRHHALDALIVALCTEEHVNYINNINADAKQKNYGKQKQLEEYRKTLKKKIKYSRPNKKNPNNKDWLYMMPGEVRQRDAKGSDRDSVIAMEYIYQNTSSKHHKETFLAALQDTIVTFKQNLRVINKTVNRYKVGPRKGDIRVQEPTKLNEKSENKYNWVIRRKLSKETIYGYRLVKGEERRVERELLNEKFNYAKIKKVSDKSVKRILNNHLKKFDTVELPFEEAIKYFEFLMETQEFEAIVQDSDNDFRSINDFINYLRDNNYKYKKDNFAKLNVFVEKVKERDFRSEKSNNDITEHPEIAFSPEMIDLMNKDSELQKLNEGQKHAPVRKVQTFQKLGKERPLSEDDASVKSKQYVVTAPGSNMYLGFYERINKDNLGNEIRERKFKDIGLIELIETLKQDKNNRYHPLPEEIYDDNIKENEYKRIFTLSPLDLVYVPSEAEIENPSLVDFENLTNEQVGRIYKYVDGSEDVANFIPFPAAKPIWRFHGKKNKDIYKELSAKKGIDIKETKLIQNEFGLGSQQNKHQNTIDNETQIKKVCWKLKVNRLGKIEGFER